MVIKHPGLVLTCKTVQPPAARQFFEAPESFEQTRTKVRLRHQKESGAWGSGM